MTTTDVNAGIAALDQFAHRAQAEEDAAKAVTTAKTRLILDKSAKGCFFGTLASKLMYEPNWEIDTAATDGRRLLYNPDFINGMTWEQHIGLLAHEALHCANKHFLRLNGRDPEYFNLGCDLAINQLLLDAGFKLPDNGAVVGTKQFKDLPPGLSAEEYYALVKKDKPEGGEQDGGNDPGGCGGIMAPEQLSDAQERQLDQEWTAAIAAAQQAAERRGELPAGLARLCEKALAATVDWKQALREFVTRPSKRDYSWKRANRRFVHAGLFLPSINSLDIGHVVALVDVSGSIDYVTLQRFGGEVADIMKQGVGKLTVVYHDSQVCHVDEFGPDDDVQFSPHGGGGTSHVPAFRHIDDLEDAPTVVVALTDLASVFPDAPIYPVLWASTCEHAKHPWGERVDIKMD